MRFPSPKLDLTDKGFAFFQNAAFAVLVIFTFAVCGGCSRVSQGELQAAVNPLNEKNYPLAIEKLALLLTRYPANAQIHYYLAFAYMYNGEHERALEYLEKTLKIDAGYKAIVGDVKMADFLAGNSEDTHDFYFRLALLELQKIISANPASEISDRVQFHLAHYYLWKEDYKGALQAFQKVLDAPPNDTEYDLSTRLITGKIHRDYLDDEAEGLKSLQVLIDRYPQSEITAEALFELAEHHREQMIVYQKRYQSLREFVEKWSQDPVFGREAETARKQSEQDLKAAEEYRTKAVAGYQKILSGHVKSGFYSRAKTQLELL